MKCFVIMPFGNPKINPDEAQKLTNIFEQWIKPTVESIKLSNNKKIECCRADKDYRSGEIITHIIDSITNAGIVIADLTGKNPNVFYELGVRHAINNNTILISEDIDDIPFDLRGLRTISYEYTPDKMIEFKENLIKAIDTILNSPKNIDNPVRRYLYNKEVNKLVSTPTPPGYDLMENLMSEMDTLKKEFKGQLDEMRSIVESITSTKQEIQSTQSKERFNFFEGIWKNFEFGSIYFGRVINGILDIPYALTFSNLC